MPFASFACAAAADPNATALVEEVEDGGGGRRVCSRQELLSAAEALSTALLGLERRAQPQLPPLVLVCLPLGASYCAALLASSRAGCAWACVDTSWPPPRLQRAVQLLQPHAAVSAGDGSAALLAAGVPAERILAAPRVRAAEEVLPPATAAASDAPPQPAAPPLPPPDIAYVCFSSGSGGEPKAVLCTRSGLLARCAWAASAFPAASDDVSALRTPPHFVDAAAELWAPLLAGVCVASLPAAACGHDPLALVRALVECRVTRLTALPSILAAAAPALGAAGGLRLRLLLLSGEAFSTALYTQLRAALGPAARILNIYGCTEAGADCCVFEPAAEAWPPPSHSPPPPLLPLGRPLPGFFVALLDGKGGLLREAGLPGELCVGGVGLARGYLNDSRLTAARFVRLRDAHGPSTDPGRIVHRTGDLASWAPDGTLRLQGRLDGGGAAGGPAKLRGAWVSLSELEAVLEGHPAVAAAAARTWSRGAEDGDAPICAYVELRPGAVADEKQLRAHAAARLPPASLPARLQLLHRLPRTAAGKVARATLPQPAAAGGGGGGGTGPEAAVALAFAAALQSEESVDADANFFEQLGGTSLGAALLCGQLNLPLSTLLAHPTPRRLAAALAASAAPPPPAAAGRKRRVEAAPAQPPPSTRARSRAPPPPAREWAAAAAFSFACRAQALGGREAPPPPPPALPAPPDTPLLRLLWRLPLGACVDASPLLLLPGEGADGGEWRCVVGSHSGEAVCAAPCSAAAGGVAQRWCVLRAPACTLLRSSD